MQPETKAILSALQTGSMPPCTVTSLSPFLISMNGATGIPADHIAGLTYTLGAVNRNRALIDSPNKPLVIPIG